MAYVVSSTKTENIVRRLRQSLGMSQQEFAKAIGRSYASVQGYEAGKRVPPDVEERLKSLAAANGLADLAMILSQNNWQVQRILHPGETLISSSPSHPRTQTPEQQKWFDMLAEILNSGQQDAIDAVCSNLAVFSNYVKSQVSSKEPREKKRAK